MLKNIIISFILLGFIGYSCNNEKKQQFEMIQFEKKEGRYEEYFWMTLSKQTISQIDKGIYIVFFNDLNRGKLISDVIYNYNEIFSQIYSELIVSDEPNHLLGCRISFYYDTTRILILSFSIEMRYELNLEGNDNINYWDYLLKINDFKVLTLLTDMQKYVDFFQKFDTSYVGGANYGYRKMYFDQIKPLDSINMIKYGKKFIKF